MIATIDKPRFDVTPLMRRRFGVRPELTLIEWAELHIKIIDGPLVEGGEPIPWSADLFPLQRAPMESLTDPRWSRTVLVTAPQSFGKTQCIAIPPLLYALDYLQVTPFYMAATKDLASAQWFKKIEPAMAADDRMVDLFYENPDFGGTHNLRHFANGTSLHMVGSESVGKISGHTAPVIICDDVQAYPTSLPRFGHPADYALTRSGALPTDQCIHAHIGTAGTVEDYLWRSLQASTLYVPMVPCPECGAYQAIDFDRFVYDADDSVKAASDTWMSCVGKCDRAIRFEDLPGMLEKHRWISAPPEKDWATDPPDSPTDIDKAYCYPATDRNTNVAGFWASALYWPFGRTWGELAADWIGRRGDPDRVKDFRQNVRVIAYAEPRIDDDAWETADILSHVVDWHEWKNIPAAAGFETGDGVMIVTADPGKGHLWYLCCAWNLKTGSGFLIEAGRFGTRKTGLDEGEAHVLLYRSLDNLWEKEGGGWSAVGISGQVRANIVLIDVSYKRDIVQASCKRYNGGRSLGMWNPVEGSQDKAAGKRTVWPTAARREKRGWRAYYECNTNRAKLYLRDLMAIPNGKPGSFALPAGMPEQIAKWFSTHLCAEEWDADKGRWVKVGKDNHFLDCMAMQIAGAMACKVNLEFIGAPPKVEVVTDYFKRQREARP